MHLTMHLVARLLAWQPARYLLAGGTAAGVHLGTLFVLVHFFGVWYLWAASVGFVFGVIVSFILQKLVTFKDYTRHMVGQQASLHVSLQLFNLGVNGALMYAGVDLLGIPYLPAQFFISAGIACYNFLVYRRYVFGEAVLEQERRPLKHIVVVWLAAIALLGTIAPAALVVHEAGGLAAWQGVPPRGTTDSLYYYARIHEVVDGHAFIGNPYSYEHRDAYAPAFFLPDLLTAVPVLIGLPFNLAMLLNIFIWGLAFLSLSYALLRALSLPRAWAFAGALAAYLSAYSFLLRPTVMQVVYAAALLFLYTLIRYIYEPASRRRGVYLALAGALTFYVYTFLAYVVLAALAAVFCVYLATRRFVAVRNMLWVALWSALLLIPFGIYTLLEMRDPYYFETLVRIGLVHTHLPTIEAYYYGRWMLGVVALFGIFAWWQHHEGASKARDLLWVATGIGFSIALVLNIFTGVDLTLPVHIGRLAIPWQPLAFVAALYETYRLVRARALGRLHGKEGVRSVAIGVLLFALALGTLAGLPRGLEALAFNTRGETVAQVQPYAAPLAWLQKNVPTQSVIWANDSISQYIPIMTRHYPLFSPAAVLHSIGDDELAERYLLSRSLEPRFSQDELKNDLARYVGVGAQKFQPIAQNEQADFCALLRHADHALQCPPHTDGVTLKGEAYFIGLMDRFHEIQKDRATYLATYHVAYLLVDRTNDDWQGVPFAKAVYDDGRFAIIPASALEKDVPGGKSATAR